MTCREVVEIVTDYLDGALPDDERARLEAHLQGCDACNEFIAEIRMTSRLAAEATLDERPDRAALLATFRAFRAR